MKVTMKNAIASFVSSVKIKVLNLNFKKLDQNSRKTNQQKY